MKLEKLREIIQSTKSFKSNPACQKLAESFENFVELYELQKEGPADAEYFERFDTCQKQFWASFDLAAESLGISPDVIKSNLNNPDFFTPDQWKNAQALRQEISGEVLKESKPKKLRKSNNKKMRI